MNTDELTKRQNTANTYKLIMIVLGIGVIYILYGGLTAFQQWGKLYEVNNRYHYIDNGLVRVDNLTDSVQNFDQQTLKWVPLHK